MQLKQRIALTVAAVAAALLAAGPAFAVDPYSKPDNSWISISGTVETVSPDSFLLDYGDGVVTVEMDDGDRDADGYKLLKGDKVTVTGAIDDDLFETTSIEASSVYVESLGTSFSASALDEEDTFVTYWSPVIPSRTVVQGIVTEVGDEQFKIHTGNRMMTIDVGDMSYDPLDDKGYQKIRIGDRVSVTGTIDAGFFKGRELEADSVLTLSS